MQLVGLRSERTLVCKVNMTYQPPVPLTKRKVRLSACNFAVASFAVVHSDRKQFVL